MDSLAFVRALANSGSKLRFVMGVISSIQTYTVTVTVSGSTATVANVKYASSVVPRVGSSVYMATDGADLWIISQLAPISTPTATATRSTLQTLTTAVEAAVTFDAVVNDGWGSWVAGAPTKLSAIIPGRYQAVAYARFDSNITGYRQLRIELNGATTLAAQSANAVNGSTHDKTLETPAFTMATGDYIRCLATQNSGGNLNLTAAIAAFSLIYLGSAG